MNKEHLYGNIEKLDKIVFLRQKHQKKLLLAELPLIVTYLGVTLTGFSYVVLHPLKLISDAVYFVALFSGAQYLSLYPMLSVDSKIEKLQSKINRTLEHKNRLKEISKLIPGD